MLKYVGLFFLLSKLMLAGSFYDNHMETLILYAQEKNPDLPFAAMLVNTETGEELCRGVNTSLFNPLLHGEVDAIANCVKQSGNKKVDWPSLTLITTAEPCAMCQGAIIWAGIGKVVFGTSINHLIAKGWRQIGIGAGQLTEHSNFNKPVIIGGVLEEKTNLMFVDRNI